MGGWAGKGILAYSSRRGSTRDDSKRDTKTKRETNLHEATKGWDAKSLSGFVVACKSESSDSCAAGKNVEEDTSRFSHAFSQESWSFVLEVQLPLGHGLCWHHSTLDVSDAD